MRFDSDRRLANMLKRVYAQIDQAARAAHMRLENEASQARGETHERFNTAARSIGQSRRQRNRKGRDQ